MNNDTKTTYFAQTVPSEHHEDYLICLSFPLNELENKLRAMKQSPVFQDITFYLVKETPHEPYTLYVHHPNERNGLSMTYLLYNLFYAFNVDGANLKLEVGYCQRPSLLRRDGEYFCEF